MRRRPDAGFTLMELLVATTIISIVMTGVYGLLYSTIGAWRQVERGFDAHQRARMAFSSLRRDIESIELSAEHLVEGDANGLTLFVVREPMNVEEGEGRRLMRVRYRFNRGQNELVREEAMVTTALPVRPPAGETLDPQRIELSDREDFVVGVDIEDFELRYVWAPHPDTYDPLLPPPPVELIYAKRQKENQMLPQGIEVTLRIQDPEDKRETAFRQIIAMPMPRDRLALAALKKMLGGSME